MKTRVLNLPHNISIQVPQPYDEGHVCTELEAAKLNQVVLDSVRTTILTKLRKAAVAHQGDGPLPVAHMLPEFQTLANTYQFTVRATRQSSDPVEREAFKLAKEQVFAAIRKKGGEPGHYNTEQIAAFVAKVLELRPEIREEATRRVRSSRELGEAVLNEVFNKAAE